MQKGDGAWHPRKGEKVYVQALWIPAHHDQLCRELGCFPMPPWRGEATIVRKLPAYETYEYEVEFRDGDRRCYNLSDLAKL